MEFLYAFLVVGHFIGLAAIVGPFLLQIDRKSTRLNSSHV